MNNLEINMQPTLMGGGLAEAHYNEYTANFNDEQKESASVSADKSLRILAGAGAGKTATIIARCINLTLRDGIDPTRIACITFTRKAAREMSERYIRFWKEIGSDPKQRVPRFSTIHSLEYFIIRNYFNHYNSSILSEYNSNKLLIDITKRRLGKDTIDKQMISKLEGFKNMLSSKLLTIALFLPVFSAPNQFLKVVPAQITKLNGDINISYPEEYQQTALKLKALSYTGLKYFYKNPPRETSDFKKGFLKHIDYAIYQEYRSLLQQYELQGYVNDIGEILAEYYTQKFTSRTYDFSDMAYLSHILMAQFPENLGYIHSQFDYIICDECQDSPPSQIALLLCLQNDTYNEFFAPLGISVSKTSNLAPQPTYHDMVNTVSNNGGVMTVGFDSVMLGTL